MYDRRYYNAINARHLSSLIILCRKCSLYFSIYMYVSSPFHEPTAHIHHKELASSSSQAGRDTSDSIAIISITSIRIIFFRRQRVCIRILILGMAFRGVGWVRYEYTRIPAYCTHWNLKRRRKRTSVVAFHADLAKRGLSKIDQRMAFQVPNRLMSRRWRKKKPSVVVEWK